MVPFMHPTGRFLFPIASAERYDRPFQVAGSTPRGDMHDGLDLDPHTVLGLRRGASGEEVREAFHRKSMKYHPDHGGDDWAFKIVVRAYEAMGVIVERERLAALREVPDTGRIRPGVHDKGLDPTRLAHVEVVWMRYEVGDLVALIGDRSEDRNLSGSLTISWPGPELADRARASPTPR